MRRLVIIFMLLLLPVQITWAGISAYCKHETGVSAQHFGHHEHQHQAQEDESKQDNPTFKFDGDCSFCQFSGLGMTSMPSKEMGNFLLVASRHMIFSDIPASYRLDRPDRPNWVRAA